MVQTLDHGTRKARKPYRCGLCGMAIRPGDPYAYQINIYDTRIYTWRDCIWCDRDSILTYVSDWAGYDDAGVDWEQAIEWSGEAVAWPRHWLARNRHITAAERAAARNWLARAAGGESE